MIVVAPTFITKMEAPSRSLDSKIVLNGVTNLLASDYIKTINFNSSVDVNGKYFGNFITATMSNVILDKNGIFNFQVGDKLVPSLGPIGETQITFKEYYITERTYDTVNLQWQLKSKDMSTKFDTITWGTFLANNTITYPILLSALTDMIATYVGVSTSTYWFESTNYDFSINSAPNISNSTSLKTVISKIAEATISNAIINASNQLEYKPIVATSVYEIDADNYSTLSINKRVNNITGIVLGRFPTEGQDVTRDTGEENVNEIRIDNNPFLDRSAEIDTRVDYVDYLFTLVQNIDICEYELKWRDTLHLEAGDIISIYNKDDATIYTTVYSGVKQEYDGGLSTSAELSLSTSQKAANTAQSLVKRVDDAYIYVDKVAGRITQLISETNAQLSGITGSIGELSNRIDSTAEETTQTIKRIGGANYIEDSAWFKMKGWDITGSYSVQHDTEAEIETDSDAILNLSDSETDKRIDITPGGTYTIAFKYKVDNITADGHSTISLKISEGQTNTIVSNEDTLVDNWVEVNSTFIAVNNYVILYISNLNQRLRLTDIRLTGTDVMQSWSPYFNEVYSSTLRLDADELEYTDAQGLTSNTMDSDSNIIRNNDVIMSEISDERHYGQSGDFVNSVFVGNMEIFASSPNKILFIKRGDN